jgi:hypothetical protein
MQFFANTQDLLVDFGHTFDEIRLIVLACDVIAQENFVRENGKVIAVLFLPAEIAEEFGLGARRRKADRVEGLRFMGRAIDLSLHYPKDLYKQPRRRANFNQHPQNTPEINSFPPYTHYHK